MYHLLRYILILLSINQTVYCSYKYVGCFTQVFLETYYTSSFMEPTLCFRLCETPVIYLQKTVCRCSGAGLMHYNRQSDTLCTTPCTKPVDRSVKTINTCGGLATYSAYAQDKFYLQHAHLFNYQIIFSGCELWKSGDIYDTEEVKLNEGITLSSLNTLERCAAQCLDKNATTKSIAFNGNTEKCLCIMPLKSTKLFERTHYLTILSNSSCDRYCNNTYEGSKTTAKYQCGSLTNPQIWAIYDLNGTCPANFIYMNEIKKCFYSYKNIWNSCTPPSTSFVYDGSITWTNFLKLINRLVSNDSIVTVDFDESVVVDRSWKCSTLSSSSSSISSDSWRSYYSQSRSTLYGWSSSNTRYLLENGCLRESSYSSYSHRYTNRLCVAEPVNKFSSANNDTISPYLSAINPQTKYCPTNWFDLNGLCYRISDERKTISEAVNRCVNATSTDPLSTSDKSRIWLIDSNGQVIRGEELNDSPTGTIVQYVSDWQARLGFFLLDTDPDNDNGDPDTTTAAVHSLYYEDSLISSDANETAYTQDHGSINEFHLAEASEDKNGTIKNDTCIIINRSISEEEEKPILTNQKQNNCTKSRHVLCQTNTLVAANYQYGCFDEPKTLDLPALISYHLTHELCLGTCQELQTKLAILQMNKCYCLNSANPTSLNITTNFQQFKQKSCGDPCPGNSNEFCGNEDIIVAFQILDPRRTYTFARTPPEPFPNYSCDGCIRLVKLNQSTVYQFTIKNVNDIHPRHCLSLCTKYEQKYALINNEKCLCTNNPMKDEQEDVDVLPTQNCPLQCPGNYFYSCGNKQNSSIYSMYVLQPKCRHGFEVAENDQQCVYSHYSAKQNSFISAQTYCGSIGSTLAKINSIEEIQDILPDSILHTRLMQQLLVFYRFKFVNDTRYYWIDRTNNSPPLNSLSDRLLKKCKSENITNVDKNCIAIQYVQNSEDSKISHERCIIESNECSTKLAMPVCVDQHIEVKSTVVPPVSDKNPSKISFNISNDYFCDDEYHFIDDTCYKIAFHETNWNDANSECQRDGAIVFVPEKSVTLQLIKSLFVRRTNYISSGVAHVGVYYNSANRTVIQSYTPNDDNVLNIPDSNAIYDLCEKTFQERFAALTLSSNLTSSEKNYLKRNKMGCGYLDLTTSTVPAIHCDEIPCNRTATVICQKPPKHQTGIIQAIFIDSSMNKDDDDSTNNSDDDDQSSTIISPDIQSQLDAQDSNNRSVGRDFAPIFFLLAILFSLLFLAFLNVIYKHRHRLFRHSQRRTANSVYSQLTSANEFDLN